MTFTEAIKYLRDYQILEGVQRECWENSTMLMLTGRGILYVNDEPSGLSIDDVLAKDWHGVDKHEKE